LKTEDVVKIDLGAHIDGYAATCAHTIVVGGKAKGK
jgi:methionine aminopeptidase